MPAQTSMLHVRVDDQLKAKAADTLAGVGLTLSDAVRILLTRVVAEGGLPAGLTADPEAHDAWFRAKVREALDDPHPTVLHERHPSVDRQKARRAILNGRIRRLPT